jgi:hypothetical protein
MNDSSAFFDPFQSSPPASEYLEFSIFDDAQPSPQLPTITTTSPPPPQSSLQFFSNAVPADIYQNRPHKQTVDDEDELITMEQLQDSLLTPTHPTTTTPTLPGYRDAHFMRLYALVLGIYLVLGCLLLLTTSSSSIIQDILLQTPFGVLTTSMRMYPLLD